MVPYTEEGRVRQKEKTIQAMDELCEFIIPISLPSQESGCYYVKLRIYNTQTHIETD